MKATQQYKLLDWSEISVAKAQRQRQEDRGPDGLLDVSDIIESVRKYGIMMPVIVDEAGELLAGERRWTCAKLLNIKVPVRYFKDLSPIEAQIVELEENHKRKALHWRDEVRSVAKMHELYAELEGESWSQVDTATRLGFLPSAISMYLRVARDLENPRIASADGARAAYNILSRLDQRAMSDALSDIVAVSGDLFTKAPEAEAQLVAEVAQVTYAVDSADPAVVEVVASARPAQPVTMANPQATLPPKPQFPESIHNVSFLDWAPAYQGRPFNFIHCDFPYGIDFNKGAMSGKDKWETYDDSPNVYWDLCKCLCENLDKVMAHSAHLMFWLAADASIVAKTLEFFRQNAPSLMFNSYPLIWHKTDNVGILPDPKRGPRRVYELALMASREDRQIVKAVGNAYGAPTNKEHHPSTKPEPVLKHFFQMFVDEHTRMLDPTCGGGSALRAAEAMGASEVCGLELSPEHFENAKVALKNARVLRSASGGK